MNRQSITTSFLLMYLIVSLCSCGDGPKTTVPQAHPSSDQKNIEPPDGRAAEKSKVSKFSHAPNFERTYLEARKTTFANLSDEEFAKINSYEREQSVQQSTDADWDNLQIRTGSLTYDGRSIPYRILLNIRPVLEMVPASIQNPSVRFTRNEQSHITASLWAGFTTLVMDWQSGTFTGIKTDRQAEHLELKAHPRFPLRTRYSMRVHDPPITKIANMALPTTDHHCQLRFHRT